MILNILRFSISSSFTGLIRKVRLINKFTSLYEMFVYFIELALSSYIVF